ncbi:maleylpyruvate isomerase family mycothiol-dependent enzyme [Pilimelia anulata]|nr:maleylpyruvate isomerase family mycothiol-dependent enzyme [Pilimelia anulata]
MDTDEVWRAVEAERAGLADLFDDLSEREWATPSLCAGWRVREVAAHLTLAHTGPGRAVVDLVRAGGSFDRMIRDTAIRRAALPTDRYAPLLRAMIGSRRRAPGVSPLEPLLDALVHGQDIAVPLGRPRDMPLAAAAAAVDRVWPNLFPFRAARRLRGYRLRATDHPWAAGDGELVEGPLAALLLLITGRRAAALARLDGPGARRLAATP